MPGAGRAGSRAARADVRQHLLQIDTRARAVIDLTSDIASFCRATGGDGLLNVFAPHATAGLALIETGSGSDDDLLEILTTLVPRDDRYRHHHGSPGHGADHVLPALISPSLTIPVRDGAMQLGTWQAVVLVDLNSDNPQRQVRLTLLEG